MSLLPLELQGLILSHFNDLEVINNLIALIPELRPLAHDSIRELNSSAWTPNLVTYLGSANANLCRLTKINHFIPCTLTDCFLILTAFPYLRTFNLIIPIGQEEIICFILGSYFGRHRSFKGLTLRCMTSQYLIEGQKEEPYLFYENGTMFINPFPLWNWTGQREEVVRKLLKSWSNVLKPTQMLMREYDTDFIFQCPSVGLIRNIDFAPDTVNLGLLAENYREVNLIVPSIQDPNRIRAYNDKLSHLLIQEIEDTIEFTQLGLYDDVRVLNLPFQAESALRLVNALPLTAIGVICPSDEQVPIIRDLLSRDQLTITIFIADPSEKWILGTHSRLRYVLGGSGLTDDYPLPLKKTR